MITRSIGSAGFTDEDRIFCGIVLLACGVTFALLSGRSLYVDEAMLALAMKQSHAVFGQPLVVYEQATPLGHHVVSKALLALFGDSDRWLRVPVMTAFAASVLMAVLAMPGRRARIVLLLLIFATPTFLRYATEVKQYGFEFAFSLAIVSAWLRRERIAFRYLYGVAIFSSLLFTFSVVFVVFVLFLLDLLLRVRESRRPEVLRWFVLHATYGMAFVALYAAHIRPSIAYQIANWPEIYQAGLLSRHMTDPTLWLAVPKTIYSLMGNRYLVALVLGFAAVAWLAAPRPLVFSRQSVAASGAVVGLALVICLASAAGAYSIQSTRHLLFVSPVCVVALAALAGDVATFDRRWFFALILAGLSMGAYLHKKFNYYFQETRGIIARADSGIDVVSLGAQPAYYWYTRGRYDLDRLAVGDANALTAPRLEARAGAAGMDSLMSQPGAWSWAWSLKETGEFDAYVDWLVGLAQQNPETTVLFSDDIGSMKSFTAALPSWCAHQVLDQERGGVLLRVECRRKG